MVIKRTMKIKKGKLIVKMANIRKWIHKVPTAEELVVEQGEEW